MSTTEKPHRLRVVWSKSRNYFQSFLTELGEVRREIGNDRLFAHWCIHELHIGIEIITNTANILKKADADIARAELRGAKEAGRAERRQKQAEAAALKEQARQLKLAKAKADKERRKREGKQQRDRDYRKRMKEKKLAAYKALAPVSAPNQNVVRFPDAQLVKEIKQAVKKLDESRSTWIDASIELAGLLVEARGRFPSNTAFGEWLEKNGITIDKNDQAALINLGSNIESMRKILESTERSSYRYIWNDVQRQLPSS